MADKSISALATVTSPASTDVIPIVSGGSTKKVTAANLITAGLPSQTNNSGKFLTTNGTAISWATPSSLTNSAGANIVPKSDGTNLVASQIADNGTTVTITLVAGKVTIIGGVNPSGLIASGNVTTIGDHQSVGNGTTLTVDDAAQTATLVNGDLIVSSGRISVQNSLVPTTAAGATFGTAPLPASSAFVGNAANNSAQITGTFTANRVATLPDSTTKIPAAPQLITVAGMTAGRTWTVPDSAFSLARIDAAQTFTGLQTLGTAGLASPILAATADGTTSIKFTKADAATVVGVWDTTNTRLRIGSGTAPTVTLDVTGTALISSTLGVAGVISITNATDSSSSSTGALIVTGGMAVNKRVFIPSITTSAGVQTAVLCQSSGGEMIADSVACLASSERYKEGIKPLDSGLDAIMALKPVSYRYKKEGIFAKNKNYLRKRIGLIAEDVAKVDKRVVGFDADGKTPRTVGYEMLVPVLVKAIQEQQAELIALNQRLATIHASQAPY